MYSWKWTISSGKLVWGLLSRFSPAILPHPSVGHHLPRAFLKGSRISQRQHHMLSASSEVLLTSDRPWEEHSISKILPPWKKKCPQNCYHFDSASHFFVSIFRYFLCTTNHFQNQFWSSLSPQSPQKHLVNWRPNYSMTVLHGFLQIHLCALQLYAFWWNLSMTTDQNTSKMQFSKVFNLDKTRLASCHALVVPSRFL